jgi:hypothetical protein
MIPTKEDDEYFFEEEVLNLALQGYFSSMKIIIKRLQKLQRLRYMGKRERRKKKEGRDGTGPENHLPFQAPDPQGIIHTARNNTEPYLFKGGCLCPILRRDQDIMRRPSRPA